MLNNPLRYTDPTGHQTVSVPNLGALGLVFYAATLVSPPKVTQKDVVKVLSYALGVNTVRDQINQITSVYNAVKTSVTTQNTNSSSNKTAEGGGTPKMQNPFQKIAPIIPPAAHATWQKIQENGGKALEGFKSGVYKNVTEPFLPEAPLGTYMKHDIDPFIDKASRGLERLVIDTVTGKAWYTPTHYKSWIPFQ